MILAFIIGLVIGFLITAWFYKGIVKELVKRHKVKQLGLLRTFSDRRVLKLNSTQIYDDSETLMNGKVKDELCQNLIRLFKEKNVVEYSTDNKFPGEYDKRNIMEARAEVTVMVKY